MTVYFVSRGVSDWKFALIVSEGGPPWRVL